MHGSIEHAVTNRQCQVLNLCISFVVYTSIVTFIHRDKLLLYVRLLLVVHNCHICYVHMKWHVVYDVMAKHY